MKIKMTMKLDLQIFNESAQYTTITVKVNQIISGIKSIEKYSGKYTHMNTMNLYTITFNDGRYAWLTDSLFEVVD